MPFRTGSWGKQAKIRSKERTEYFREYYANKIVRGVFSVGRKGEILALSILDGSNDDRCGSHDVTWNGKRIEVKTANLIDEHWKFCIRKNQHKADMFLFICIDKRSALCYLIPSKEIETKHFYINKENLSAFDKYLIQNRSEV